MKFDVSVFGLLIDDLTAVDSNFKKLKMNFISFRIISKLIHIVIYFVHHAYFYQFIFPRQSSIGRILVKPKGMCSRVENVSKEKPGCNI